GCSPAGRADRHGRGDSDRRRHSTGGGDPSSHPPARRLREAAGGDRAPVFHLAYDRRLRGALRPSRATPLRPPVSENRRRGRLTALAFAALLIVAATLRLQGVDWDQGQHLHPDERFLTMVETAIALPHSVGEYFDTAHSALNPGNHEYKFF